MTPTEMCSARDRERSLSYSLAREIIHKLSGPRIPGGQPGCYGGVDRMDWRHHAACREVDPELFFPIGNTGPALFQIEEAKAVCRRCPVVESCQDRKAHV